METITLEELRDQVWMTMPMAGFDAAFNAAIRERDELCSRLDSALGDRIREFRRANDESRRAEKAEAELAALKKRMKPCARVENGEVRALMGAENEGKYVAVLIVEGGDEH